MRSLFIFTCPSLFRFLDAAFDCVASVASVARRFDTGYQVDVVGKVALLEETIRAGETVANKLASKDGLFFSITDFDLRLLPAITSARTASPHVSMATNLFCMHIKYT